MDKFIIYGGGKIGKSIFDFLVSEDLQKQIYAVCDQNYIEIPKENFSGTKLCGYEEVREEGLPFIIGVGGHYKNEVEGHLLQDGADYYYDFEKWMSEYYKDEELIEKQIKYYEIRIEMSGSHPVKKQRGICPFCGKKTIFVSYDADQIRENYQCIFCHISPRKRALFQIINEEVPQWRDMEIHESSPGDGTVSMFLQKECKNYTSSYYFEDGPLGDILDEGVTNQNLENMTFADESFDVFVTQDVLEHVNEPDKVFREISRVLKVGGRHIFTVPIWHRDKTVPRIKMVDGKRELTLPPIYHGNPISEGGSLLTYEWGEDLPAFIDSHTYGCTTLTQMICFPRDEKDITMGLEAGTTDSRDVRVFITTKVAEK